MWEINQVSVSCRILMEKNLLSLAFHIDDCHVIGKVDHIQLLIIEFKRNGFNLKVKNNFKEYLSCHIIVYKELNQIMIVQPHLIKNCETFLEMKCLKREPTGPLERPDQDLESQSRYRSGVGMLIYLTKCSRPVMFNVLRDLCKYIDDATMGTYLETFRVIKFVLDTENFRLKIQSKIKNKNRNLKVFCGSD
jgi:hypothetical protein